MAERLGVGFIGSGFITRFHIRSWEAVRDADIRGIYSPTRANAEDAAMLARSLHVGVGAVAFFMLLVALAALPLAWRFAARTAR